MPSHTGVWSPEEAETGHVFDYKLAQWLGQYFSKDLPLIDLGCGPATYLRYFHDIGFQNLHGIEGSELNFEFGNVLVKDLTSKVDLGVRGNVMCIEVAEHIPEGYREPFMANVLRHLEKNCKLFLSWGIPGQDGLGHVNCQHNIWVIDYMEGKHGLNFLVEDSLRARAMVSNHAHWLRDTIMVFEL